MTQSAAVAEAWSAQRGGWWWETMKLTTPTRNVPTETGPYQQLQPQGARTGTTQGYTPAAPEGCLLRRRVCVSPRGDGSSGVYGIKTQWSMKSSFTLFSDKNSKCYKIPTNLNTVQLVTAVPMLLDTYLNTALCTQPLATTSVPDKPRLLPHINISPLLLWGIIQKHDQDRRLSSFQKNILLSLYYSPII